MGYESKLIDYELLTQKRKRMARRIRGTMKITSVNNDLIKETAKLLTGVKYRNDSGLFILEGKKCIEEAIQFGLKIEHIFSLEGFENFPQRIEVTQAILSKISDTKSAKSSCSS